MSLNDLVRDELERLLKDETLRSAGAKLGYSHQWVRRRLTGTTPLSLDDLEAFTTALGLNGTAWLRAVLTRYDEPTQDAIQLTINGRAYSVYPRDAERSRG